jgi:hypothetical protein
MQLPNIKDYCSIEWTTQIPLFDDVMFRVGILQIFWMSHEGNDILKKAVGPSKEQGKCTG